MLIPYTLLVAGGQSNITAFVPDAGILTITSDQTNFEAVKAALDANKGDIEVDDLDAFVGLFDASVAVSRAFERLSERVHVDGSGVYFDGDRIEGTLVDQILRVMDEGEDPTVLVNLWENIAQNPSPQSVEQLYDWIAAREGNGVKVTPDGMLVGYKGVESDGNGGYRSLSQGTAFVNDEKHTGKIPNAVGDTVTMPRGEVVDDPHAACHRGLHVGTFSFARSYSSNGVMLRVLVNPRDVVSVPHDARGEKIRVCRYVVDDIIEAEDQSTIYRGESSEGSEFRVGNEVEVANEDDAYYGEYGVVVTAADEDGDIEVEFGYCSTRFYRPEDLELI